MAGLNGQPLSHTDLPWNAEGVPTLDGDEVALGIISEKYVVLRISFARLRQYNLKHSRESGSVFFQQNLLFDDGPCRPGRKPSADLDADRYCLEPSTTFRWSGVE